MTDAELAAIEARCRAATAGPWERSFPVPNPDGPKGAGAWFASVGREGECDLVARSALRLTMRAAASRASLRRRTSASAFSARTRNSRLSAQSASTSVRECAMNVASTNAPSAV